MNKKDINIYELKNKYFETKSCHKTAEFFNISSKTVMKKLNDNGIDKLKRHKYTFNEKFFSLDTPESFYWAGFIAADGCVRIKSGSKILSLSISGKDYNHLEKFKNCINFSAPIKIYTYNNISESKIILYSDKIFDDLARFNIVQRKTKIYTFPEWIINHELVNHFMRGYFDGDGSFYIGSKTINAQQVVFSVAGTKKFITTYKNILSNNSKLKSDKKVEVGKGIHYIRTEGNNIVRTIRNFLYKNATILLERKYNVVGEL